MRFTLVFCTSPKLPLQAVASGVAPGDTTPEKSETLESARRSQEAQRRTAAESSEKAGRHRRQAMEAKAEEDRPWNVGDRARRPTVKRVTDVDIR
jgi:hypothetical protein